ncbi:MAG: DctP family TRAP transporter solute-binding subunit [Magnetococcales bacterium]|nr:DctP family TRAP transporter solute-binding subunit [Magnetococcales bacterium]NGZ05005.1 DctP family TRAP transporter solute-binding subunit [Magnetococcales bacterium]
MKRFVSPLIGLLLCALVGWSWWPALHFAQLPVAAPSPEHGVVLRLGHNMPRASALGMAADQFAAAFAEATKGNVRIEVFPEGSLGNDLEMVEKARSGALDLVLVPTAKMSLFLPAMQYPDLPFYFPTPELLYRLLDGEPGQLLLAKLRAFDLVGLTFLGNGFKQFTANRPLYRPEDLEGLKVRVMKSRLIQEQFQDLGAKPLAIEFRETRQALADGVVDAQENPLAAIVAMGIHQVQSHLTMSDHAYLAYVMMASAKTFAALSDGEQTRLMQAARAITPLQREETGRQEQRLLEQIQAAGVRVNRLSAAERHRFATRLRHLPFQFEESIGSDLLSKTEELLQLWQMGQNSISDIVIGLDTDLSLSGTMGGRSIKRGAMVAIEEINRAGGVLGRKLVLRARDNMAIPGRGEENLRVLAADHSVVAVIGGMHSTVVKGQTAWANSLKIPLLIAWAAGADIVEQDTQVASHVFRLSANDRYAGPFLVDKALEQGTSVALILENTLWGRSILPYLQERLREKNRVPVLVDWVNRGESDWGGHMEALRVSRPDVALWVLNADEGAGWLRAVAEHRMDLPVISHWGITGGQFFEKTRGLPAVLHPSFLHTFALSKLERSRAQAFQERYRELFDQDPEEVHLPQTGMAHAYDLIHLLAVAIRQAGTTERAAVRDALERIPFHAGLIKNYRLPFVPAHHDALERSDYFLARFDPGGAIVPLEVVP